MARLMHIVNRRSVETGAEIRKQFYSCGHGPLILPPELLIPVSKLVGVLDVHTISALLISVALISGLIQSIPSQPHKQRGRSLTIMHEGCHSKVDLLQGRAV